MSTEPKVTEKKVVDFVIKTSKFCNLRCRYCYEFNDLGNREMISSTQLDQMYHHIADYYGALDHPTEINFVWHGGEPLIHSPEFYWKTFESQKEIFRGRSVSIINSVQTNLTVLDEARLQLLKTGFDSVGVSLDLFGGLRVNQSGRDSVALVLKNLDRLQAKKIPFGCITVLTQLNRPYIEAIFRFYEQMEVSFRILPLFKGAFDSQHIGFEITPYEVLETYKTLVDLWFESDRFVMVHPIVEHIEQALRHRCDRSRVTLYDKRQWESIFLVNTDGQIYSYADAYAGPSQGNIFTTPMETLLNGKAHQLVIQAAEDRLRSTCHHCPYLGSCDGYPVAEGSVEYNEYDEQGAIRCIVTHGILRHIEERLDQARQAGMAELPTEHFTHWEKSALSCAV
ncbi:radical SAM protein [Synechococcales cyanobacterium C]|uniref:Radical SAM protein n=2 Tax=Petrachloros TaxID=2918834 RepID=A0A8K2A0K1_9CYAN|nr:radical SAM protein [Petrachloros mirabilis ULC683]